MFHKGVAPGNAGIRAAEGLFLAKFERGEGGLAALDAAPANEAHWDGPYLKKTVPPDPWGKPYIYRQPGEHNEFDLYSYGKDGQAGGTGDAVDVTNW